MNGKDIEKERKEAYNRFAKHYNNSDLSTFAELTTIQQGLEKRIDEIGKKLRKYYDSLQNKLELSENDSKNCIEAKKRILKKLEKETKLGFHIQSPERMGKELSDVAADYFKKYCDESKTALNIKMFRGTLNLFLFHSQQLQNRGNHLSAIRLVTGKIVDKSYPEKLPEYEHLSVIDKEEIKSGAGNPNWKKGDMPNGFYDRADKLKRDNPKQSQSWIEDELIRKYFDADKSKKSTVYRRLKKYWNK